MKKVFLALYIDYDQFDIHGCFSTREKAQEYIDTKTPPSRAFYYVDEYVIDEAVYA